MPSRPSAMRLLLNHATVSARPRKRRLESYKQPQVESEKRRRLRAPNRQPDSEAIDGRTRLIAALTARGKWLAHHDRFLLLNGHSLGGIRMAVLAEKQPTIETLIVSQSALVRFIQPRTAQALFKQGRRGAQVFPVPTCRSVLRWIDMH